MQLLEEKKYKFCAKVQTPASVRDASDDVISRDIVTSINLDELTKVNHRENTGKIIIHASIPLALIFRDIDKIAMF